MNIKLKVYCLSITENIGKLTRSMQRKLRPVRIMLSRVCFFALKIISVIMIVCISVSLTMYAQQEEIYIILDSAQFMPLSSGDGNQVKVAVNYTTLNSTIIGQTVNAVMKIYAFNETALKMTSFPNRFTANSSGIQELNTTVTDNQTANVIAVQFTDAAKTIPISNPVQIRA